MQESAKSVLIIGPYLENVGGVANYYRALQPHLPSSTVCYLAYGPRDGARDKQGKGARIVNDYWRVFDALRSSKAESVLVNMSFLRNTVWREMFVILLARLLRRRYILFIRGWRWGFADKVERSRTWKALLRHVYFKADGTIVLAKRFGDQLRKWGLAGPVFLETTTVEDGLFEESERKGEPVDHCEAHDEVSLVFLSRLEEEKGIYIVLETFKLLRTSFPRLKLIVAGDGPERANVEKYLDENSLTGVSLVGYIRGAAKKAILKAGDVFVFPSSYGEGMPNALLEAMAREMVIVTRPVGGISDFFEEGRMGFITESNDARDFARLAAMCIEDHELRGRIGAYNRDYAEKHFRASTVAKRLLAITSEVAKGSRAN